jgi:hypothetical protein
MSTENLTRTGNYHHKGSTASFRKRYLLCAVQTFNEYMCFAYVRYVACMMMRSAEFVVRLGRKSLPSFVRWTSVGLCFDRFVEVL